MEKKATKKSEKMPKYYFIFTKNLHIYLSINLLYQYCVCKTLIVKKNLNYKKTVKRLIMCAKTENYFFVSSMCVEPI